MERFPPPPDLPQPTPKPVGMSRDFRNSIIRRVHDLVMDGTDDGLKDEKCQVLHALLDLFSAGDQSERRLNLGEKLEAMDAVLTSFQDPNMNPAHLQEIKAIHEAPWQATEREGIPMANHISFLDNISARRRILEQIQEAEYPVQIPITPTTRFSKLEKKYFSKAVWSALWVTPFNSLQDFSRKISRHEIRWFNIRNLFLAITDDLPDVMDIECLAFLFGKQKIQEYQDALRSGYLESPANLIALDEGVRTTWDQCKITLRVKSFNQNEVNLALHYLHDSELRNRTRAAARYRWENDLTVTPADVLFDLTQKPIVLEESSVSDENTTFGGPADMDLVSTATQHFQDGSTFKVYAEDPKLRPDPILLDLRDKLAVVASLLGAAECMDEDDDHSNDSEGTRQSAVDEVEDYQSVDGDISDMGEDLYMDDDNYRYDLDE
ncbi:hypothetical protein COL922a_011279 [Colletotrichum nupharicola]|nr:hypothetical protein COL922a_011279 [Colletotrichum nupharicola]